MLAAYRSDELPRAHPIRRMRSELRRSGHLRQVMVEPLDAEATATLVDRTLGSAAPTLRRAVFDRTDGIPLYVTELAAALAASGLLQHGPSGLELLDGADVPLPDSVRDAVLLQATGFPMMRARPPRQRPLWARCSIRSWYGRRRARRVAR